MIRLNRRGRGVKNHRKGQKQEKLTYLNEWTLRGRQRGCEDKWERPYLLLYRTLQAGHIAAFSPYLKEAQNY